MARLLNEADLTDLLSTMEQNGAKLIGVSPVHKGYRYKGYQVGEGLFAILETESGEAILCEEAESFTELEDYLS